MVCFWRTAAARLCWGWLLCTAGCTLTMKRPESSGSLQSVPVRGHSPSLTARDRELRIGEAKVDHVEGTRIYPAGLTAYGRLPEQKEWDYQFEIHGATETLRGECHEVVGKTRYYGLGETTLDVACRCLLGNELRAEIRIEDGRGKASIAPDHRFAVFGTRASAQGKRAHSILGYRFQSGKSVAAVDVTKRARGYIGVSLPPEQRLPMQCLFAGLLLHRPRR